MGTAQIKIIISKEQVKEALYDYLHGKKLHSCMAAFFKSNFEGSFNEYLDHIIEDTLKELQQEGA